MSVWWSVSSLLLCVLVLNTTESIQACCFLLLNLNPELPRTFASTKQFKPCAPSLVLLLVINPTCTSVTYRLIITNIKTEYVSWTEVQALFETSLKIYSN